jgi:hypothetical protein
MRVFCFFVGLFIVKEKAIFHGLKYRCFSNLLLIIIILLLLKYNSIYSVLLIFVRPFSFIFHKQNSVYLDFRISLHINVIPSLSQIWLLRMESYTAKINWPRRSNQS